MSNQEIDEERLVTAKLRSYMRLNNANTQISVRIEAPYIALI